MNLNNLLTIREVVTAGKRSILLRIEDECKPYVRTTQRGKWVSKPAIEYGQWHAAWKERIILVMAREKIAPFPQRQPVWISASFGMTHLWKADYDNLLKSVIDLLVGTVMPGDRYVLGIKEPSWKILWKTLGSLGPFMAIRCIEA